MNSGVQEGLGGPFLPMAGLNITVDYLGQYPSLSDNGDDFTISL